MPPRSLDDPALYINRHASWLAFDRRVLEEAEDETNPLLERVKFLAISASNLDEFFEVQVAGLLQRIEDGQEDLEADAFTLERQREVIARETHALVADQYRCWNDILLPRLRAQGVRIRRPRELGRAARAWVAQYAERELDPLLTPVTVDPAHPFPFTINKAVCLALQLRRRRRRGARLFGVITIPRALPRLVRLPAPAGVDEFIFLTDLVAAHARELYSGYEILASAAFRVTRNSNLYLAEEETRDVMESVRSEVVNRRRGAAVRLEIEAGAPPGMLEQLRATYELQPWQVFEKSGPVNLPRLMHLYAEVDRRDLKFRPFLGRVERLAPASANWFAEVRRRDVLLHHPFDAYDPVVDWIRQAAADPRVLAIKQTLYRTSQDSPIVAALLEAAPHKEVTAVVELMARFDETSNLRWAHDLQQSGAQVVHGFVGLKTHCKLALLVRRDEDGEVRRYAHLGTGNYNPDTARLYTDLSLLTADSGLTAAVDATFGYLTAYAEREHKPLLISPLNLATGVLNLIAREADHARQGRPAGIVAKMNGLLDRQVVQALYRAAQAGVRIDLQIRGMCSLRPGIRGVSDRIHVSSVVGRFLEHSRIWMFANGGNEEIYLTSADWMPRNLYGRIEVAFPIRAPELRRRIREEILSAYLADTAKARFLDRHGAYIRAAQLPQRRRAELVAERRRLDPAANPREAFSAQEFLMQVAEGRIPRSRPAAG